MKLLLCLISIVYADEKIGLCCLCSGCGPMVDDRVDHFVDGYGKTCNDLYLELADPGNDSRPGTDECVHQISIYRPVCCDPEFDPVPVTQIPTSAPLIGDEPVCNICLDGSFPTLPYSMIVTLPRFIEGVKTCEELYYMGIYGFIPEQICKPLVKYAEGPCGCSVNEPTKAPYSKETTKLYCDEKRGNLHLLRG